jgi:dihydroflavonol-4-reductase
MSSRVLVTGFTGFIASHIVKKLVESGYSVRGTVRNKTKAQRVLAALSAGGVDTKNIELVEADLGSDKGWHEAVQDCRFIQHVASPFPLEGPDEREGLVPEARAGAQRVLEHGFSAGAERIVLTSSVVSMIGQKGRGKEMRFTDADWSDPDWPPLKAYAVSKTRAELSAWAYAEAQGLKDRLVTVCPGLVFGPDSFRNSGASLELVKALFAGQMPKTPKIAFPIIDVRDCASIHVAAMKAPEAAGRRLIAGADTLWMSGIAEVLRAEYPRASKLPKGELPSFVVKIAALFDDRIKGILPDLGTFHSADTSYVTNMTGVMPRPAKEAILAAAQSLIANRDIEL